ncbi:MAG: TraX family protein [Planctomycetota bacterium]
MGRKPEPNPRRRAKPESIRKAKNKSRATAPPDVEHTRTDSARTKPSGGNSESKAGSRNANLDALRGLAILLMMVDHTAAFWFDLPIEVGGLRFLTRLSMPLFCVLLGYFLDPSGDLRPKRYAEVLLAAVLVNLLHWPLEGELEILPSLLLSALAGTLLRSLAPVLIAMVFVYQTEPSSRFFDYQLSIVMPLVAHGVLLRRFGLGWTLLSATFLLAVTSSGRFIYPQDTHRFLVWFLPPAIMLTWIANRSKDGRIPVLPIMGRHPLTLYVVHYYLVAGPIVLARMT